MLKLKKNGEFYAFGISRINKACHGQSKSTKPLVQITKATF